MRYSWMKETAGMELLPEDYKEIIDIIGLNNFIRLLRAFDKSSIYFSQRLLQPLLNHYIIEHGEIPAKKLAKELRVSLRYIYKIRQATAKNAIQISP